MSPTSFPALNQPPNLPLSRDSTSAQPMEHLPYGDQRLIPDYARNSQLDDHNINYEFLNRDIPQKFDVLAEFEQSDSRESPHDMSSIDLFRDKQATDYNSGQQSYETDMVVSHPFSISSMSRLSTSSSQSIEKFVNQEDAITNMRVTEMEQKKNVPRVDISGVFANYAKIRKTSVDSPLSPVRYDFLRNMSFCYLCLEI